MPRSIFDINHRLIITHRLETLTPQSERLWGKLTVIQMLAHCRKVNEAILVGSSSSTPTPKEKSIKFLVVYIIRRLRRGINSGTAYLSTEHSGFENEYYGLIRSIEELAETTNSVTGNHPVFGRMKKQEWGYFVWMHLDHHLRQFGK